MILAADKPNYLPQISFFYKLIQSDQFVIADDIRFTSHDFINRSPIKSNSGETWLTVPVLTRGRGGQLIKDVQIDTGRNWRRKQFKAICVNYKYTPYFEYYIDFFDGFYQKDWRYLIDLNYTAIEFLVKAMGISIPLRLSSALNIDSRGTAQIIDICKAVNCHRYLAWENDKSFLKSYLFTAAKIEIRFLEFRSETYHQQHQNFLPNLSIIDLLFNLGPIGKKMLIDSLK